MAPGRGAQGALSINQGRTEGAGLAEASPDSAPPQKHPLRDSHNKKTTTAAQAMKSQSCKKQWEQGFRKRVQLSTKMQSGNTNSNSSNKLTHWRDQSKTEPVLSHGNASK